MELFCDIYREGLKQKNNKILLLSTAAHVYQTETNQASGPSVNGLCHEIFTAYKSSIIQTDVVKLSFLS